MKGPRKREASQPAYDLRFRGALEDGARGEILVCPYMSLGFTATLLHL